MSGSRPVWNYHRASTVAGRVRRWWNYRVLGYEGETCDVCGRRYDAFVWWCPDDALFRRVCGHIRAVGLVCPACFDRGARQLGQFLVWRPKSENQDETR